MAVEYNRSPNAQRDHVKHSYWSSMGRSSVAIDCPFCGTTSRAFVWSLAGGGKCCENRKCGAKHASFGVSFPRVGREDMQPNQQEGN
jgi:hypothetical protein